MAASRNRKLARAEWRVQLQLAITWNRQYKTAAKLAELDNFATLDRRPYWFEIKHFLCIVVGEKLRITSPIHSHIHLILDLFGKDSVC